MRRSPLITFLRTLLSILVVLAILLGLLSYILPRRSFPQVTGQVQLAGLEAQVDVYRDSYGIPQIYAASTHDLFFAQGYIHAQDRFWQMDFSRHIGSARLSEMFGDAQINRDIFLRTLGWARVAQQELDAMDPSDQAILQAYADGVNAYLADHQGTALSLEYAILKLLSPAYQPEPWTPIHTLTWGKVMSWSLGSSRMESEIAHAVLLSTLTPAQVDELFPPYPTDQPLVLPDFSLAGQPTPAGEAGLAAGEALAALAPAFQALSGRLDLLQDVLGPAGRGIGSNNWVIAGAHTASGLPLLANDMHLGEQMPSIWYENGLHCQPVGPACPYQVSGFSFAGVPGVIVGHTDRTAWGFTNVGPDVLDLYIEKINPANPNQYEVNGQWVDMTLVHETIQVSGADPVELTVRYTRHGPIIYDTAEQAADIRQNWGLELPENFAIAIQWTALQPADIVQAILGFDRAQNWDEFRQAAAYFSAPAQNIVYADVDGNIAYQTPGLIPIRQPAHTGQWPVPGWTDEHEWQGFIPFEQLPTALNPERGYIVTANNAIVGPDYPYPITIEWDQGFRAARIVNLIENAPGPITVEYIQGIHGDDNNASAGFILPILLNLPLNPGQNLAIALDLLANWDAQDQMDLAAPAIYNVFWKHLLALTFQDDLPEDYWPSGDDNWFEIMRLLVQQPDSAWWDDRATPAIERRDDIFLQALAAGIGELEQAQGSDPARWSWGDLHTITFHNQSLGLSGIAPIEAIFNRGPYRASGGPTSPNATTWNAAASGVATYQVVWMPSMRMIADFSDLSASLSVNTTGQSGHAYHPNYADQVDLWRTIQYHPMLWERSEVESAAAHHLVLTP